MSKAIKGMMCCMAFLAGGCLSSVLPDPAPPPNIYRLSIPGETATPQIGAITMRVDRPTAPKALLGQNVVVSPDGRRLLSASGAKWAESIPSLVQHSFFDILARRPGITGILPASGARSEYRAHLTIRSFEAEFDRGEENGPLAIVEYMVTVSNAGNRNLIGTKTVRKTARASDSTVSSIVSAQNTANLDALNEVSDWIKGLNYKS